jgi:hypothetical protein
MEGQDSTLSKLSKWKMESEDLRRKYDYRWSRNLKLIKGVFREQEQAKSKVRDREKIFFRKIWSTIWRLTASMYYAFLKDPNTFKIEGRDTINDPFKAKILQTMVEYRRDRMANRNNLFLKFIWAFQDIFQYGWCCGKMCWVYKEGKKDEPQFILYPPEQCFPDLAAETGDEMRYIHFLNYMTMDEMESLGYENLSDAQPSAVESSIVRQTRNIFGTDPLQNPGENEYPSSGRYQDDMKDQQIKRYKVFESFWQEDGEIKYGISNDFNIWLKKPDASKYGDKIPAILGVCLTESHKMIGEGFPEPLEGPQESYNYILNMRKDNVSLAMTGHTFVSRWGGVDLQSLVNRRMGGYTMMDDVNNSVRHEQVPDVTQSSYVEAAADDAMMQEISGVTAGKVGMERAEKATVAQINFTESNAKIDLYIAMIGETFVKNFYLELARQIQMFETDENIFRIANNKLRQELGFNYAQDVYDLDFEADCIINVSLGTVGRDIEVKQTLLAMDRAIMTMQAVANLAKLGAIPKGGLKIPDVCKFFEALLPQIGHKNVNDFFINLPSPGGMQPGMGGGNPAMAGAMQPQVGNMGMPAEAEMIQQGSMGGV